ncbi:MAG TPA: hypothetical protein VMU48_06000 [Terracidiphilus sp.]|nr:hypothetical protein [Terracidiphilus sp.]
MTFFRTTGVNYLSNSGDGRISKVALNFLAALPKNDDVRLACLAAGFDDDALRGRRLCLQP